MEGHFQIAIKGLSRFGLGLKMQTRHLVFILIRQQLVVALRNGLFQRSITRYLSQKAVIALGQTIALISHQMIAAEGDFLVQ